MTEEKPDLDIDGMLKGKIPASNYRPTTLAFSIDHLHVEEREHRVKYYADEVLLFQFRIPPFQRAVVWTEDQCIRFIESAYRGYNLGTYVVNKLEWTKDGPHPFDMWLLDGLQRLTAIWRYQQDEFKVFGYHWSELDRIDKCRFGNVSFSMSEVRLKTMDELKQIYNALNFGGTVHTDADRAM